MAGKNKKVGTTGVDLLTLLPEELLHKILLPLPIDSLVNLARTSPHWRDFICSPEFARKHLLRWRSNYGIISKGANNPVYWTVLDVGSGVNGAVPRVFVGAPDFPDVIWQQLKATFAQIAGTSPDFLVLDSCDGQILVRMDYCNKCELLVCNPMLMSCRTFSPPKISSPRLLQWNLVFVESSQRYKIIGMSSDRLKSETPFGWGRTFYILDIRTGDGADEWTEVSIRWDEVVGESCWHGGPVLKSVTVQQKDGVTKLYYLGWTLGIIGGPLRSTLIAIDVDTHDVTAVQVAACPGMRDLVGAIWAGASTAGKFYVTDSWHATAESFNVFAIEDFHNPVWKLLRIDATDYRHLGNLIQPFACVDNGKILYEVRHGRFPPDRIVHPVPDDRQLKDFGVAYNHRYFYVRHVHSFIRI